MMKKLKILCLALTEIMLVILMVLHGLTKRFNHTGWDIVGNDVIRMVLDFFAGILF